MTDKAILVLREPGRFDEVLRESGFEIWNLPLTATRPLTDQSRVRQLLHEIDRYDGCFFTSPVAAEIFVKELGAQDVAYKGKLYVLGQRANEVFEKAGYTVEFRAGANTARELIEAFSEDEFAGKQFLFVRGERSMRTIPEMLSGQATVDETAVYETVDVAPDPAATDKTKAALKDGTIEWVCFFAPSAVDSLARIFELSDLKDIRTAAIGETTARRIEQTGMPVNFISATASSGAFASGLIQHIKSIE